MKILITGANGFLGKNLQLRLRERTDLEVITYTHSDNTSSLPAYLKGVNIIFHLAGVNRPKDPQDLIVGNIELTQALSKAVQETKRDICLVYSSSTQASLNNDYGKSKRRCEEIFQSLDGINGNSVHIFRFPSIFGKWCLPDYNSVVATFCHNIAHELPIRIDDPDKVLRLVYIDEVIDQLVGLIDAQDTKKCSAPIKEIKPTYTITVSGLARQIRLFHENRANLNVDSVGSGFLRALYATYISYLPIDRISYSLPHYPDRRGVFIEMLQTSLCGQISVFTAHPGISRGGHYHNTKTEKFLVVSGQARFRFRHMHTGQDHEVTTSDSNPEIVETIPGWTHDITNIGTKELVVILWSSEVFDRNQPDTYRCPI